MSRRVRIGTCANPPDAALVRSMFAARGIHAVVGAEHHASLLGPLGASFLSLDIWVDEEVAEEAAALLRDLRERSIDGPFDDDDAVDGDAVDGDADGDAIDGDADGDGDSDAAVAIVDPSAAPSESMRMLLDRRRRTATVVFLGCFITFGTAHMYTRAWLRGIALAGLESLGLRYAIAGIRLGSLLIVAAVVYDMIGALWRIRHRDAIQIPAARIHNARQLLHHDARTDRPARRDETAPGA